MSGGFLGSTILDVAIGLFFVYLVLALVCTGINEWFAGLTRRRARLLEKGVRQLLEGQGHGESTFVAAFYAHPLIQGLMRDRKHPSYLPARAFSAAVLDLVLGPTGAAGGDDFTAGLGRLGEGRVKTAVTALTRTGTRDLEAVETRIEEWYEDAMDRVSGWYKRETQVWTAIIAFALTILINADTTKVVRHLWTDPALRAAVIAQAGERVAAGEASESAFERERELLGQVVGWGAEERRGGAVEWLMRVAGWLLTGVAISLGAPFWFDVLNKFMDIRSTGKSPDESAKKPETKKLPPADRTA